MNFSDHVLKMGNHVAIIEERLDECDTYDPTHVNAENIVHEKKQAAENDNENHSSFKSIDQIQDLAESEDQSENHKRINGYVSSPDPHSHEGVMDRKDTSTAQHNMPIASMKDQSISISDDNLLQVGIPISETEGNLMGSERNCILKSNNHNVNSSTTTTSELESPGVRESSSDNREIHRVKSKAQNGGSGSENIHISPLSRHLEKANDKQKGSSVKLKCDSKSDGTFSKPLPKEMVMPEAKDAALQNAEASNTPVIVSNDSKYSKVNANHINDDALIQPVKHKSSSFMKASEIPAYTSKKKLKSNLVTKQIEVDIVQKKLGSPDKNGRIVLKQVTQDDRGSLKKNTLSICNSSQVNDLTPEKSYHKNVPASILGNKPNIHKPRISVLVNGTDNKKSCTDGAAGPHQEYKHRAVLEKKRKDVCRSLKSLPAEGKKLNEKRINSIISQVISSGSGPIQLNCLNSNKVSNTDADPSASLDNMHVIPSKDNDTTKAVTSVKVPEKAKLGVKKSKMFLPRDNGYSKNRACNEQSFQTEMVHKSKKPSVISKSGSVVISKKRFGIKKPNASSLLARKGENRNHISLSESNHHHHPCQIKFKKKPSSNVKKNPSHVIGLKETPSALSKHHNSSHNTSHTSENKNKVEKNDVTAPTLNGMFPNSDENPDESTSAHIQRKCEQPLSHEPASKTASKCQSRENEICRTLRVSEIRNTKDNKISLTLSRCVRSPNQHKKANYSIVPKATSLSTQVRKTISKHQGHTNYENYSTKASEVRNRANEDEDSFHGIDNNSTKTLPKSTSVEQKGRHMAIQEDSPLKTQNLNGNICTLSSVESKSNEKVYMPASSDSGLTKGKPGLNTLQKKLKKSLAIYIDSVKQNQGCSGQNLVLQNKDIQDGNNCMISSRHGSVSRDITSKNKVPVTVTRKRPSVSTAEQMQPSLLEAQDSIKKSFSQLPQEKRRTKKKICNVSPNNERCATKNAPALSNTQDMPKYTTDSVQKQKDCHDSNFSYESMQKSKNFELIIMPINPDNNSSVNRAKEGLNMIINKKSSGQPKYTISNPLGKNVSNPPSSHSHPYESSSEKPHRAKKWDKHDSDIHKPTSTNKVKPDIHVEKSNKHSFDCRTCSAHTDKPKVVVEKTPYSYLGLTEVSAFKDSDDDDEDSDCAVDTAESSTNLSMEHEVVKRRKRFRTSCSEVVVRGSKVQRQSEEESNDETDRSHNSDEGIEELEEPTRLADIPCIASEIHESPDELLQTLHGILFGTSGVCHNKATLQKMIRNILNFSGFPFIEGSESYNSKLKRLKRLHFQFLSEIESILFGSCIVSRSDAAEKILNFLMHPTRTEAECLRKTKACKLKPEDLEQYERLKREILESDGTFPIVLVKKMKVDEIERYLYPEANDLAVETDLSNSSYDNSPEMSSSNLTAGIGSISEDPDFIPMPSPRKSNGPRQATNGPRQATNGPRQSTNGTCPATNGIHTKGRLLKSFAEIAASIANADQKILSLLHVLLFGNDGDLGTRRQHILEFSGFSSSHHNYDMKNRKRFLRLISSSDLKSVCKILHLNFPNQEKDSMIRGLLQFIRAPCEANLTLQPRIRGPEKASKRKAPSPLPFTKPSTRSENAKKPLSRNGSSSTSFSDASFSPVSAASASSESNMSMEFRSSTVCQRLQYTLRSDSAPHIVSAQNHGCSTYQNSRNEVSSRESLSINTASASSSAPKVNVSSGKPLESFETIRFNIECATPDDLTELYDILFVKPCDNFEIHQKILQFRGFDFNQDSTEFHFRKTLLSYMNFDSLKKIAKFLNLLDDYTFMHKGELENRIMKFFVDLKDMKQGSYSSSPGKRTHIVRLSEQTNSLLTIHHEVSQPSTSSGSSSQGDTQPLKIKEDLSPVFSSCSLSESHPLVGRLKADLSSSSEDEIESTTPLITFANHPSDTRLRKDIREILYFKNFNITMKELIAMVFAKYPKYDLRYRSNFIKSKARHILSNLHRQ